MMRSTIAPSRVRASEPPLLATRVARAHLDAMTAGDAPYRALLLGTAGSGKSRMLRQLRRTLTDGGVRVMAAGAGVDIPAVPASDVLLVDDAHLMAESQLAAIASRVADPEAALVLAARPWPQSDSLARLAAVLERTQPAILLGHLARPDVLDHVHGDEGRISARCVDGILEMTGGVSWLVAESLSIHDDTDCTLDSQHTEIQDALEDVIAHRLRTTDPAVRDLVERLSLTSDETAAHAPAGTDALLRVGYAEGLLLRNGRPAPVVRSAARATVPVGRLISLYASGSVDAADGTAVHTLLGGLRDPRVAAALLEHGDAIAAGEPHRAAELYRAAADAGADAAAVAIRQAEIAWALGDVDGASGLLDAVVIDEDHPDHHRAADAAAAIWATRGLATMSDAVYRSFDLTHDETSARAAITSLAVADRAAVMGSTPQSAGHTMPSTRAVAMQLLGRGMRDSLTGPAQSALTDLVRASEMYSASGATGPIPELPAVIAALTAINLGELDVARSVLDGALREEHGGRWAHDRLVLWRAWVALQQEHAHEVESAVRSVLPSARSLSPRDKLLFDAISIAIARRYHDSGALITAWRGAGESLLRARFDVFSQLPLGEFVLTAARVGESDRMRSHFAESLTQLERLGSPPVWAAHLRWTGIQQGILLNRPDDLAPHARALVDAAPHNRLAAMMAQAGRVWTAVLSGTVDADLVEKAALGLASVGLAWDGARLAGHGAGRTQDRRAISRLLACARRLHPREEMRPAAVEEDSPAAASRPRSYDELSPREREVAALVIEGKTYAEIGASIFISPRTAEHHIARIRRRLGATTRSDLITKLRLVIDAGAEGELEADGAHTSDERASA